MVRQLLNAHDPDTISNLESGIRQANPDTSPDELNSKFKIQHLKLIEDAVAVFNNPDLRNYIVDVRKKYDQVIDTINIDTALPILVG